MTDRELLLLHAARYPLAEPTDLLKLVYQSAFGAGHLITDLARVTRYIEEEMQTAEPTGNLLEPIGGGYARLYLGAARQAGLSAEEIASRFFRASEKVPDPRRFETLLSELFALSRQGAFCFTAEALSDAVFAWEAAGRPLFRHSERYRRAYAPAYRLTLEEPCS
jgi:hypothetical protein